MSEIRSLMQEEVTLGEVSDALSDEKLVLEICRKRKRSNDEEEENEVGVVEEDNDGFRTPTRPENRIPEVRECPPAPRKVDKEYSAMLRGKKMLCRRRLTFSPEDAINTFISDLQWRTATMMIKK